MQNKFNNKECSSIITDYHQINTLKVDEEAMNFDELLHQLSPFSKKEINHNTISVVIFYGKFVSSQKSINKQSFEWYEEIKQATKNKDNVNILLVSLDVMESWNLSQTTKQSIGIE